MGEGVAVVPVPPFATGRTCEPQETSVLKLADIGSGEAQTKVLAESDCRDSEQLFEPPLCPTRMFTPLPVVFKAQLLKLNVKPQANAQPEVPVNKSWTVVVPLMPTVPKWSTVTTGMPLQPAPRTSPVTPWIVRPLPVVPHVAGLPEHPEVVTFIAAGT